MNKDIKCTAYDRVTFTSLRPIGELDKSIPVLLYDKYLTPIVGIYFDEFNIIIDGKILHNKTFIGWQYLPLFKPNFIGE